MSNKSNNTKKNIIDASLQLFADKGYQVVTMKDICDRCGLSRGGLYRYFSSTKELFIAMLDGDIDDDIKAVKQAIEQKVPAKVIFEHYLDHEKNAIFSDNKGLFFAAHEFAFAEPEQRAYFDKRVALSVDLLGNLFRYGQETGEFKHFDSSIVAAHIIYFFDGLKTSSSVLTVNEEMVDQQLTIIKGMVI
ncbi:TetR/AcrR family transcriptional regulator [Desulfosporosinus sp. PR]|uniref:TetR/AcrR family transcriptional regulator n=1 Tax=Candidatus Desulfosporosinus nitrosoreducens TaxID=3401928 RepID=UPI0027E62AF4|nr:TetR/AcrR family transcriptional regulator [Desulfosporosinus sp. PR]MDQ7096581.1 TetR/AcrR family transcriptional regulator [Desulfosporosinus sp. PR]